MKAKSMGALRPVKLLALYLTILLPFYSARAQNVSVTGALTGNGTYGDLSSAFVAINGGSQSAANITVNISGNLTETVSAVLASGSWSSLLIRPVGGNSVTVTGSLSAPLIDLDGASNVLIDGLNAGGNALVFTNASQSATLASTIRFINGASSNTITNCTVLGASTSNTLGTIWFATAGTTGNNNNLVSVCDIGPSSGNPVNGILSAGTATAANTGNMILNNNIFDYFSPALATSGILTETGSDAWTITGNKLYQTAVRTYTTAQTHKAIFVNTGSGYIISSNIIGYASAAGTGLTEMAGTVATRFAAIQVNSGTAAVNSIQGNTMTAITLTTSSTAATANGILCGIYLSAGSSDVGTVTGNLIGGTSGTGHFRGHTSGASGMVVGISASTTGSVEIRNNSLGGFSTTSSAAGTACGLAGLNVSAAAATMSIVNNVFGNATAGNMQAGTNGVTTAATNVSGINLPTTPTGTIVISGNIIRNFVSHGSGTGYVRGLWTAGSTAATSTYSITGNLVSGLSGNSALTTISNGQAAAAGIVLGTGGNCMVANNTVSAIALTNTGAVANIAVGIAYANTTSSTIRDNMIYDITNSSTNAGTPPVAAGVIVRSGTNDAWIHNNMISLGGGSSSNTSFIGIQGNHGSTPNPTVNIFFNTISIQGTVSSGSLSTFGIHRGDLSTTARNMIYNIRNNLVTNTRTGGTGGHYAIGNNFNNSTSSATGWTSDYNVLNANSLTIGHWTSAQGFAGWKTASSSDATSYSGIAVSFVNINNDLHLNFGTTPTVIESGGQVISGFNTDIDNQSRPGPAGSLNGGGSAPDIGADEFDGVVLDVSAPVIVHTPLTSSCITSDRTFTAQLIDATGVPVAGALQPRVYFKKNTGSYVSAQGVLASGTASNGIWSFTISASALSGLSSNDVVSYYIVAQDVQSTPNIAANPSAGFAGTSVNNVTSDPTSPHTFSVSTILSGTYTVGGSGNFGTLTEAADAYNKSCLAGAVTFMLIDPLYNAAETFPITFSNNPQASAAFSLLVRPAVSVNAVIQGSTSATAGVLKFVNAQYITVDGINSGGATLEIRNPNTGNSASIWLASTSATGPGNNHIGIRNVSITGGGNTTATQYGIVAGVDAALPGTTAGMDNDNITIEGVNIQRVFRGIWAIGTATGSAGGLDNWKISNNIIGPASTGTGNIGGIGIYMNGALNATISGNQVRNLSTSATATTGAIGILRGTGISVRQNTITAIRSSASSSGVNSIMGIHFGNSTSSSTMAMNVISGIENTNTSGYGARGIIVNTGVNASAVLVQNNMVSDVVSYTDESALYWPIGIAIEGTSGDVNVDHNSVSLTGNHSGLGSASGAAGVYVNSTGGNLRLRSNIFSNTYDNSSSSSDSTWGIYCAVPVSNIVSMDYNGYYGAGSAAFSAPGSIGTAVAANLLSLQTLFGNNLNSAVAAPLFNSTADLHMQLVSGNLPFENEGTPVAGVTIDIDGQNRSATTPDMGADEFTIPSCTVASGGVLSPASATACAGQTVTANSTGANTGLTSLYEWKFSVTPGGPYIPIPGGSGGTTTSFTSGVLATGVYYIVMSATCGAVSQVSVSNEGTLTVNAVPSASASVVSASICSGNSLTLNGNTNLGATYQWNGPNAFSSTSQNPVLTNIQPAATGVYTLNTTALGCTSQPATVSVFVEATPSAVTVTPNNTLICSGNTITQVASGGTYPDQFNFTPQTNMNSSTSYPAPYTVYYGGQKTQFLILASELTGAGITAGSLTAIQFPVVSLGSNWGGSMTGLQSFQVSVGHSNLNATAGTFETGLSIVSPAAGYTPVVGYGNMHTFTTPFVWNGTSNIMIETVFSNNITGTTNDNVIQYNSPTTFQSTMVYKADGQTFGTIAAAASSNDNPTNVRPDFKLHWQGTAPYTWSPSSSLSSATAATVNAFPAANTIYTLVADNNGCTSVTESTLNVTPMPTLAITADNYTVCAGRPVLLTASGAGTYTWDTQAQTSSITVNPQITTTYTVSALDAPCAMVSESVTIVANQNATVTVTPSSSVICANSTFSLFASGAQSYIWSNGSFSSVISLSLALPETVTVYGDPGNGCSDTATIFISVNPQPTVLLTPAITSVCVNTPVNLTASGADTYSWTHGPTSAALTVTPATGGNVVYSVEGKLTTGCAATATASVFAHNLPAITASADRDTICTGESTELTATGQATFAWMPGPGGGASFTVDPSGTTVYTVTGTDDNNCVSERTVLVVVDPCAGIAERGLGSMVRLYPNPTSGLVTVDLGFDGQKDLVVMSASGAVVERIATNDRSVNLDLRDMAKGIYFVHVSASGRSSVFKVIVD